MTDEELVELCRSGNREAFGKIFARYEKALIRFFYYGVNDRDDAEDLAYETFKDLIKALGRFEGRSSFKNFVYAIAKNKLKAFYSRHRRTVRLAEDADEATVEAVFFVETDDSDKKEELVRLLLRWLDGRDRRIIDAYYLKGMSIREIAAELGMTETNVKVRKKRILERLEKKFIQEYEKLF